MKKNSKKGKKWSIKFVLVFLLLFITLIVSVVFLFKIYMPVYHIKSRVDNIKNYINENEEIKAKAWLRVQGTNIDYPVIDNNSFLNTNSIKGDFTWTQGLISRLPNKAFILGHNIRNISSQPLITNKEHSKFEQLLSFVYYDFVKENKYIQYTIGGKDYLYKVFSVSFVEDETLDYISTDYDDEKMDKYIKQSLSDSYFDFDIEVDQNDNIISLITCTRFYGATTKYMFKVDARMVRDDEKITNYKVRKKKKYNDIEKILRGENDEQEEQNI